MNEVSSRMFRLDNGRFSPWRDLRHLSIAQRVAIVSFFGQLYFFVPVMTPYLQGEGLNMAQIAGLQTVLLWAMLVMEIPTGVIADRIGHRRSYQIALAMTVGAELWFAFSHTYPTFIISQLIAGTGFAFASGSVDAYVYESLPEENRTQGMQKARGMIGAALHLASVVAYGTTSFITTDLTHDRMVLTIWMGIVGLSIGFGLSMTLKERPGVMTEPVRHSSHALLREGWVAIRTNRGLQRAMLLAIVANAFGAHLLVFYQDYFLQTGVSGRWFGLALSLGSLVAVVTQLHAWRLIPIFGKRWGMIVATGLPGLLYLLMALNRQPALAVLLFIVQWGAVQLSAPLFSGFYNEHLADRSRATALSLISAITTLYIGAMGIFFGWMAERSLPLMFGLMGALIVIGVAVVRLEPDEPIASDQPAEAGTDASFTYPA